jgi:hypothetical protein
MNQTSFDIGDIGSWIEAVDQAGLVARIEEIEGQIAALMDEGRRLHAALDFKEKWDKANLESSQHSAVPPRMQAVPEAHVPLDSDVPVQGKTDAALRVLGSDPHREWPIADIAHELITRGWMENSESDHASLASTLSRLNADGKIYRPQRGRYQLAPPSQGWNA